MGSLRRERKARAAIEALEAALAQQAEPEPEPVAHKMSDLPMSGGIDSRVEFKNRRSPVRVVVTGDEIYTVAPPPRQHAEIEALKAECDALRADARRYLWHKARNPSGLLTTAWGASKAACEIGDDPDAATDVAMRDDSVPIWETLAEIGESAPAGTWDALPAENCREGINDAASR